MKTFKKAPTVKIDTLNKEFNLIKEPAEFFIQEGKLFCNDDRAVDYYGEFRGGYPWISPELVNWAEKRGGYWEWQNSECIVFAQ